jgi:hypothetical protein
MRWTNKHNVHDDHSFDTQHERLYTSAYLIVGHCAVCCVQCANMQLHCTL